MLRTNLPRAIRHLRRHRRWRQSDLAERTGVSRQVISRVECGQLANVQVGTLGRLGDALGATVDVTVRWQGEQLDRLIDAAHAHVVESAAELLRAAGWLTRAEVSFNHYGDRGRVDLLALHAALRILLVTEAKSAIGDTQDTVGRLDVKTRVGPMLAEREGWARPRLVVPALVIADRRAARRTVQRHGAAFSRFELRGRSALAWLRHPHDRAPSGLLWFANVPDSLGEGGTRGNRVRTGKVGP